MTLATNPWPSLTTPQKLTVHVAKLTLSSMTTFSLDQAREGWVKVALKQVLCQVVNYLWCATHKCAVGTRN